ncbi:hypothetical protein CTEN210_05713 [Chaetoceros tenuissimus]|uniref:Uncharacterized protein n=1 Tax=Chaetoceros tenuissimus TaxID=426638 RepID=A0AAD3CNQ3_9STRA|nr:hypothetical protein CTEN210_05713 [Chaetoceros tenuissimus]
MLEQIAKQSNSIVIASSIPVTFSKNPLNHFQLAKSIAIEFNKAYRNIVVDEYGEEEAANMNVLSIGYSLGSRLQMIKTIAFDRDANILVAFNNSNVVKSVPGAKKLLESRPSPQQLWDEISNLYDIDKTLLVQFDQDLIVDSESFQTKSNATGIIETESNSTNTNSESFAKPEISNLLD